MLFAGVSWPKSAPLLNMERYVESSSNSLASVAVPKYNFPAAFAATLIPLPVGGGETEVVVVLVVLTVVFVDEVVVVVVDFVVEEELLVVEVPRMLFGTHW